MPQHILFYFSGTGNSLKAALTIARKLEEDQTSEVRIVCMGPDEPFVFDKPYESVGFVFPCYFGGVPSRVLEYLQMLDIVGQEDAYLYAVVTYGALMGSQTIGQFNNALSKKGLSLAYGSAVKAFSNYVVMYKMSTELTEKTLLLKAELEPVVADILAQRTTEIKQPGLSSKLYRKVSARSDVTEQDSAFVVSDTCTHCAQCMRVCPVNNITMEGDPQHPVWRHRCTQCLACLQLCPAEAIDFGAKTKGRGRYKHPEITVKMLIAYNHNQSETLEQRY